MLQMLANLQLKKRSHNNCMQCRVPRTKNFKQLGILHWIHARVNQVSVLTGNVRMFSLSQFVNRSTCSRLDSLPIELTACLRVTSLPRFLLEMSACSVSQQFFHLTARSCVTSYFPKDRLSEHFKITYETMLHSAGVLTPEPTQFITKIEEFFWKIFLHFQKYREKL
jgi:hypothetical protein